MMTVRKSQSWFFAGAIVAFSISPSNSSGQAIPERWKAELQWRSADDLSARYRVDVVTDAVPTTAGLVALALPLDKTILLLDSTGRFAGTLGREGEGPGEFRMVSNLGFSHDTLWATDIVAGRVTLFPGLKAPTIERLFQDLAGSGVREGAAGLPQVRALLAQAGVLVTQTFVVDSTSSPLSTVTELSARNTVNGNQVRFDTLVEPRARLRIALSGNNRRTLINSFAWREVFGVERLGRRIVTVHFPKDGPAGTVSVAIWNAQGELVKRTTHQVPTKPVGRPEIDMAAARFAQVHPQDSAVTHDVVRSELLRILPRGSMMPPVTRVLLANDLSIWLRVGTLLTEQDHWIIVSPAGDRTADLFLPPSASRIVLAVDHNRLWTSEVFGDADDRRVYSYRIIRPR